MRTSTVPYRTVPYRIVPYRSARATVAWLRRVAPHVHACVQCTIYCNAASGAVCDSAPAVSSVRAYSSRQ